MLKRRLPSPSSLFIFEAAARTLNFSRAATELSITQPAVSRSVAALECYLGQTLFHRSGPRLELTECGETLSRVTTSAWQSIEHVIADWENRDPGRETVLLSISSAMATHWLIPRLGNFRERFPKIDLRFELIPGGVGGGPLNKCDLGLRVLQQGYGAKLDGFYIDERIQAIGSPAYLQEHGTLEEPLGNKAHTLIALTDHWCAWTEYARRVGITLPCDHQILTFSDYSVVLQTAVRGQGLALGWISVTSRLLLEGALVAATNTCLETGNNYYMVGPSNRPMRPLAILVREWMIEEMRNEIRSLRASPAQHGFGGATLELGHRWSVA